MIEDNTNRLLMSDSLRGQVPELESDSTDSSALVDSFIIVGLELYIKDTPKVFAGNANGVSFEESSVKIDVRVNISEAYDIFSLCSSQSVECRNCYITHGEKVLTLEGPYRVASPKVFDFDRQEKLCTLSVDLIKA